MVDDGGYRIGDVANGYVLTEQGWKPIPPDKTPQPRQYRVGDVANGYVLTEQGWQPLGGGGSPAAYVNQPPYGQGPVQPAYQPAPGSRSRKGLWIVLAVVAVLVVGLVGALVLVLTNLSRSGGVSAPVVSTTTASPSPSPSSAPSSRGATTSAAPQGKTFAFGDTASVTLDGAPAAELTVGGPKEFTSTNQFDKAEQGRFVSVPVTLKATGTEKVSINPFDFEILLPDGQHLSVAFVAGLPKDAPAALEAADVKPGETITGSVPFDVPVGTPLKVAYSPELEILGTWQ
jgi:Domain of unknown function (DUF4352)